ncbi:MAG: hypothetical protein ACKVP0_22820 [Pirellulaceae bacterium]
MPYDVSVSRSLPPKFPDRCVLCGADNPEGRVRFSAGASYGAFFFLSWLGKGKKSIEAPACGSCAVSATSRNLMRFGLSAACAILAGWFLFWAMGKGVRGLIKIKALGVFFAAVIPAVVWDWLFPAKFSVTFDDESHRTVCHFSDATYAAQFDALNHPPIPDGLELPGGLNLGDKTAPQPLVLPANFNPTTNNSSSSPSSFNVAESYEDKSNPFRNLEDPRFKK